MDIVPILLIIILALIFVLPFISKTVEHNLEFFLFGVGLLAIIVAGALSKGFIFVVLENKFMYFITAAVFIAGFVFKYTRDYLGILIKKIMMSRLPLELFVFLIILILGLLSSIITGIVAALVLVEIINLIHFRRKDKINIVIIACFSIGLGAALTPIGEPLTTIVATRIGVGFFYFINTFGLLIIPGVVALGILGAVYTAKYCKYIKTRTYKESQTDIEMEDFVEEELEEEERFHEILFRTFKIFIFIIALEFLGEGFKPLINTYVIILDSRLLYWGNMVSSILDNATLASAEISIKMSPKQIESILMGLLISGGMLIPGNIPNIISASKLKIKSNEWARVGLPIGLSLMAIYYVIIFVF